MRSVIVVTSEDGSLSVVGTPSGAPFASLERAEQVADLMRDPHSAIWVDGEVSALPIGAGE